MFDIGFSELVLVGLLALLVLGPKRLPEAARMAGQWVGKLRRFLTDVKQDFNRELNTAELDELRQLKQELSDTRRLMQESSTELYNKVTSDVSGSPTIEGAPTTEPSAEPTPEVPLPDPLPDPLREPPTDKPRRPRKPRARTVKKNGRAKPNDGN